MTKGRYNNNNKIPSESNDKIPIASDKKLIKENEKIVDSGNLDKLNNPVFSFLNLGLERIFGVPDKLVDFPSNYFKSEKIYESELDALNELNEVDLNDYMGVFLNIKKSAVLNLSKGNVITYVLVNYDIDYFPEKFKNLKGLKYLIINYSNIGNLDYVLDLKNLESISLNNTVLKNSKLDISKIMAMNSLKSLDITNTRANLSSVELKQLIDYCKIKNIELKL